MMKMTEQERRLLERATGSAGENENENHTSDELKCEQREWPGYQLIIKLF